MKNIVSWPAVAILLGCEALLAILTLQGVIEARGAVVGSITNVVLWVIQGPVKPSTGQSLLPPKLPAAIARLLESVAPPPPSRVPAMPPDELDATVVDTKGPLDP